MPSIGHFPAAAAAAPGGRGNVWARLGAPPPPLTGGEEAFRRRSSFIIVRSTFKRNEESSASIINHSAGFSKVPVKYEYSATTDDENYEHVCTLTMTDVGVFKGIGSSRLFLLTASEIHVPSS